MRVMVIVKANESSEAGKLPTEEQLREMGKFNEELVNAGVLLAADGLQPSSKGKRVLFGKRGRSVIDGPFAETKELVAGFWLWQVKSMEEALAWVKRMPDCHDDGGEIEIRPVYEAADFGEMLTPELKEQNERLRARTAART
ncbi:MAG TPA: YciI family protein [Polyangiaceae bacterium]|nr:YciI family protein [Polyangiaceae bacterium]